MIGKKDMDVISDRTDVLRILPEAAAELCSALFRNSPAGIYITRDGKFIYTNIEFRRITGYNQDELSGKDYQRLINPRYRQQPKQNVASLFEENETTSHEFKITTKDGKKKWISEKITYFKYGGNWLTLGHWLDISEPHSVEKAWHEAERRFQSAFEDLATGLAIIGTDGVFLKVNKAFCDMLGYDEKDILEGRFDQIVHPEEREAHGDIMALFLSLEKPELPAERRLQARDSRTIWSAMSISLIGDSEGGPTYFIVHFQDITEQKRIEEGIKEEERLYRSLVDLSLEPVAVTDLDGHITHVSHKFVSLLGFSRGSDLIGRKIASTVKPDESQNVQPQIMDILRQGVPGKFPVTLVRQDGTAIPAELNITWIDSDKGAPACIVISPREIKATETDGQTQEPRESTPAAAPAPQGAQARGPELEQELHSEPLPAVTPLALVIENTSTAIMLVNGDTTIAAVNAAFEKMSGYSREEIEGKKSWIEFVAPEDQPRLKRNYLLRRLDPTSAPNTYEFKLASRSGNVTDILINITPVPGTDRLTATLLEVSEYKKALQEAQPSPEIEEKVAVQPAVVAEDKYLEYLEAMPESVVVTDAEGTVTFASPKAVRFLAHGIKTDIIGKNYIQFIRPGLAEDAAETFRILLDRGELKNVEAEVVRTDGVMQLVEVDAKVQPGLSGEPAGVVMVFKDITKQKLAELAKEESEKNYHLLAQHITDVVTIMDMDLNVLWISPSSYRITGFTPDELRAMPMDKQAAPESSATALKTLAAALQREKDGIEEPGRIYEIELELYRKDGTAFWTENKFQFLRDEQGRATGIIGQGSDVTAKKKAEQAREESEKLYRLLAEHITDVVWMMDLDLKFIWISDSSKKLRGYSNEETASMPLDKLVTPESLDRALDLLAKALKDEEEGNLPPDRIYALDLEMCHKGGFAFWTENRFQFIRDEHGKATGFIAWGRDITDRKRMEETLEQSLVRLEKTVEGSIQAIATVIELRDPYTSGHQERVARIAGAIAREMGLPDELVKCVEITGKIHDIGKIYVPMEILSKPSVLSNIERQIIQTHARGSYDILKSIDFPWPVAEAALQHHERLNGSGYPQGLKENEIMLEAKILMVADVVEAMASYRPYRASRGLDEALSEISKNSGILYDSNVVTACLRLFREKGLTLEDQHIGG